MRYKGSGAPGNRDAVAYELDLSASPMLTNHYGAPQAVYVSITTSDTHELRITLRWLNKTTTRLPESLWFEFKPPGITSPPQVSKMGTVIDPSVVVVNGSSLHGHDAAGVVFLSPEGQMRVVGLHTPLVATNEPAEQLNLWHFPHAAKSEPYTGTAWNLFNNLWNTNYIYWYPWRNATATEDDAAMTFQWSLALS